MSEPNADVTKMFGVYLRSWHDALARWTLKCSRHQRERKKLKVESVLVADARSHIPKRPHVVPDARLASMPPGVSPKSEERLRQLDAVSVRCERNTAMIKSMISLLTEAKKSGTWSNQHAVFGVRAQPNFIAKVVAKVSLSETIVVLEVKFDWWRIRTSSGLEGWVHKAETLPTMPAELSIEPGRSGQPNDLSIGGSRG